MKIIAAYPLVLVLITVTVDAEVTRKSTINPDGTIEYVFYNNGKEIAKQKVDDFGNIVKTTGTIPDGVVKGYSESKKLEYECHYRDNKLEGILKEYSENGKLLREWIFKDNKLNGATTWYYDNGGVMREFNYKDGTQEGAAKKFYENGGIWSIKTYKNGQFISRKEYDQEGTLKSEWHYSTGETENQEQVRSP